MPEIHLPVFEGPLDLLLHLIERNDLDITAVSLVQVTDQYLGAIHRNDGLDAGALAEFIAVGAKLIYLKSRALLPQQPVEDDAQLEEDDVGRELIDLLKEYKRFGEVTDLLEDRQEQGLRVFPRVAPPPELPPGSGLDAVTLDRLTRIMREVLTRKRPEKHVAVVRREPVTLTQRVEDIRRRLQNGRRLSFRKLMEDCETRVEVIVMFFAILELLKSGECDVEQPEPWGDIDIVGLMPAPVEAAT
jgi:segregation and condensation protein A